MSNQISDRDKARIASEYIRQAPPGEFSEVFSDVRSLLGNDQLLKEGAADAFAEYNMEQFTPAKLDNAEEQVIVSRHGLQDGGRYLDPRSKQTFKYHHLKKEASDPRSTNIDERAEPLRSAIERAVSAYAKEHYPNGVVTVYGASQGGGVKVTVCVEDHKFSPQNFWNGRWRSEWSAVISGSSSEIKGTIKVQVSVLFTKCV